MFPKVEYTITLKQILDSGIDIGLKDYPIWNEEYRETLNKKIVDHYYLREIGQETPGLFIRYLNVKMNEIMPYYCKIYATTQYEYNPIYNADYTREHELKKDTTNNATGEVSSNSETSSTATTDANTRGANVDTPQSVIDVKDIDSLTVASELNFNETNGTDTSRGTSKDSSNTKTNSTSEDIESYKEHLQGNYGVKTTQAMIQEERDITIDVDMMIIAELSELFMGLW